ncbi:MAG: tubulin-like doman-containing protein [Planctomycetia bacterium]
MSSASCSAWTPSRRGPSSGHPDETRRHHGATRTQHAEQHGPAGRCPAPAAHSVHRPRRHGPEGLGACHRRLYERSAEPLPIYAFLGVDTDQATLQKGGTSSTKGMRLDMDDLLHIGLDTEQVNGILENLATTYGHYRKWLPVQKIKDLSTRDFTIGASQTRPLGRLLFLQAAGRLADKITARVDRVTSKDALASAARLGARANANEPAKVDVVVVASIGGGTGSGGFLDCAYLLQAIGGDKLGETRGVILLPDVFEPLKSQGVIDDVELARIRANGYGALRELEFFGGLERHEFPTDGWPAGLPGGNRKLKDPPFQFTYLFSRHNSQGNIEDPELVYDHVADALALPLSDTTLAGTLRGSWSNAQATLATTTASSVAYADSPQQGGMDAAFKDPQRKHVLYKRPFNCRYSSMGIASVTLRVSELWRLASARLLALVAEWELGTPSQGRAAEQTEAAMKQLAGQPSVETKNQQAAIEQACGDRNLSSTEVIAKCREQVNDLRSRFKALRDSQGMAQGAQLPQAVALTDRVRELAARVVKGWDAGQRQKPHRERVEFFRILEGELARGLDALDRTDRPVGPLAGQSQWEDLELPGTGGKRLIDLHGRAEALLRQKVKQSALQQLDDQRHVLETALRELLLAEIRKQASKAREAATEDCSRVEDCIRALERAQDDLRKAFDDRHNWVLTKTWADSTPALDAQISQALAEKTGQQAEAGLGDAALQRVRGASL